MISTRPLFRITFAVLTLTAIAVPLMADESRLTRIEAYSNGGIAFDCLLCREEQPILAML